MRNAAASASVNWMYARHRSSSLQPVTLVRSTYEPSLSWAHARHFSTFRQVTCAAPRASARICTSNKPAAPRVLSQQTHPTRPLDRSHLLATPGRATGCDLSQPLFDAAFEPCVHRLFFFPAIAGYDIGCRSRQLPSGHGHSFTSNPSRIVRQSCAANCCSNRQKLALGRAHDVLPPAGLEEVEVVLQKPSRDPHRSRRRCAWP